MLLFGIIFISLDMASNVTIFVLFTKMGCQVCKVLVGLSSLLSSYDLIPMVKLLFWQNDPSIIFHPHYFVSPLKRFPRPPLTNFFDVIYQALHT